jgi:hypothetical protein
MLLLIALRGSISLFTSELTGSLLTFHLSCFPHTISGGEKCFAKLSSLLRSSAMNLYRMYLAQALSFLHKLAISPWSFAELFDERILSDMLSSILNICWICS